mmetsp:Transcript_28902/g.47332  ORF Transcript_28902/g.47332 Transcript_28902/m.47332 type:complete len:184 (-) Transcript_28902:69-620(-)
MSQSCELSKVYKYYVIYEAIMVNLVGFVSLFFQCELQRAEANYVASHPNTNEKELDLMFLHFWLKGDYNCSTRSAHCLSYMICGWLFIAGTLQIFINFDGLRRKLFPSDTDLPRSIKIICMYSFFICDWYWVVLMYFYRDVIGYQQIVGSMLDILLRVPFAINNNLMFKKSARLPSETLLNSV